MAMSSAPQPAAHEPPEASWVGGRPKPPGIPWIWGLACLALGWYAGVLFRVRHLTGINVMDMFGFWCLVGAGLCAARFFALWQAADARQRILHALTRLPQGVLLSAVPRPQQPGRGGAEWLVVGPGAWWVVGVCDVSAAARRRSAQRQVAHASRRLQEHAQRLRDQLRSAGVPLPSEPQHLLVLSRRPQPEPSLRDGVWHCNPEQLPALLEGSLGRTPAAHHQPAVAPQGAQDAACNFAPLRARMQQWWESAHARRPSTVDRFGR